MSIGLALFIFLLTLILVSIGPLGDWKLDENGPLDDDDLPWAAAGYGSAAVSLNCLFSAYAATLLLIGPACFFGVVAGVIGALLVINSWLSRLRGEQTFQSILYGLRLFDTPVLDRLFWFLVSFCQLGLAMSEFVLLHQVFKQGMGFPNSQAIVATLSVSCVAYYYCLFGGYRAVFRTDALQFLLIVVMGCIMLSLAASSEVTLNQALRSIQAPRGHQFLEHYPLLRMGLEALAGFALGIMPVLAAPDAWKRVYVVLSKDRLKRHNLAKSAEEKLDPSSRRIVQWLKLTIGFRSAPPRLLLAATIPVALITPLLLKITGGEQGRDWSFPLERIFELSPDRLDIFIAMGMIAAFMSTFDGAVVGGVHVLLRQFTFIEPTSSSELHRFRILLGLCFVLLALLLIPFVFEMPNAYTLGASLVGPFALTSGCLLGTSFGYRTMNSKPMSYLICIISLSWIWFVLGYISKPGVARDPYLAAPLVSYGCLLFFVATGLARVFSKPSRTKEDHGNTKGAC